MRDYEIRDDIPLPSAGKTNGLSAAFRKMTVGQSVIVPAEQQVSIHACARSVGARMRTRNNGNGTVTVWCVTPVPQLRSGAASTFQMSSENVDPIWNDHLTPDGELPSGEYRQDHPLGPQVWYADRDENGQPVNRHKKPAGPAAPHTPTPATAPPTPTTLKTIFD